MSRTSGSLLLISLACVFVLPIDALGQTQTNNTPVITKKRPIPPEPPDEDQQQHLAYWTSETGWSSELQLRNNAASRDLIVTPVLRLPNGTETGLSPVTIKPQEVRSIDLSSAIFAAAAPQLIGTFGSAVIRFRSPSSGSLYAAIMVRRAGHAVAFHIDATGEAIDVQKGSREGIWWLPKDSATDYLVVSNQGGNTLAADLHLYDASGKEAAQKLLLGAGETQRLSVRSILQHSGLTGSYGGIKISAASHAGSLNSLHFLFDEEAGFSAILKMFDYDPRTKLDERDYAGTGIWTLRAPMLALSNPDSSLGFPPDVTLQPELFIRNTTTKPIDASLRFNWRTASATGKAAGPALRLAPYETRRLDVAALQGAALPKAANWTSVAITTNSNPDELVAVAASYDTTLRYGAQTPFSDQLTFMWEGGMWEYDPYHDSIITAGNGGAKPTRAAFTIFYNQGTQRYDLEQDLHPDEQMWIDIGKLIREHVPDKNGNTLPADVTSGSYQFRDLINKGVGTLFEGKVIYDKTYGHVAYGCGSCCGYSAAYLQVFYDPLGVPFQSTAQQGVTARQQCTLTWDDVSDSFLSRWASANTGIATVDYYGTHTGVSIGSTTSNSSGYLDGHLRPPACPQFLASPRGGANVADGFSIGYNAFIDVDNVQGALYCSYGGLPYRLIYIGDANRGTYRTAEQVFVIPDFQSSSSLFQDTGPSRSYGKLSPANGTTLSNLDEDNVPNDCFLWHQAQQAIPNYSHAETYPAPYKAQEHYTGSASNPLESPAATITWDMTTVVDDTNRQSPTATVSFNHTCFPAHQIKVNGTVVYQYHPPFTDAGYIFNCLVQHINPVVGQTQPKTVATH